MGGERIFLVRSLDTDSMGWPPGTGPSLVTGQKPQRHDYLVEVGDILSDCENQVNVFLG